MNTSTIQIQGTEFKTPADAIQDAADGEPGRVAIVIGGRFFTVRETEAEHIAATGTSFAYLNDRNGRLVTVPVN